MRHRIPLCARRLEVQRLRDRPAAGGALAALAGAGADPQAITVVRVPGRSRFPRGPPRGAYRRLLRHRRLGCIVRGETPHSAIRVGGVSPLPRLPRKPASLMARGADDQYNRRSDCAGGRGIGEQGLGSRRGGDRDGGRHGATWPSAPAARMIVSRPPSTQGRPGLQNMVLICVAGEPGVDRGI